ncbi:MAG: hypothetical protein KBS59_03615, partial [Clostridiales bacterium]|nr:hypothetical protein [Clostridiales bacterium]
YTVSYENNINAGTATANITLTGKYSGTLMTTFAIAPKTIGSVELIGTQVYDGTEKKPAVKVTDGNKLLIEGTDYTVTYANNVNAGIATATVSFMGNYTGTVVTQFAIKSPELSGGDDGTKPLVIFEIDGGFDPSMTLDVEVAVDEGVMAEGHKPIADYKQLAKDNEEVAAVYVVRLIKDGKELQPKDLGNGVTVKVRMLVPENLIGKTFRIIHVHSANDIVDIVPGETAGIGTYVIDNEGYLVTVIDRLSEFAFFTDAEKGHGNVQPEGNPEGIHFVLIAILAAFIGAFVVFTFVFKKKLIALIACGACAVLAIFFAFFGGCGVCTAFTVIDIVVPAGCSVWLKFDMLKDFVKKIFKK